MRTSPSKVVYSIDAPLKNIRLQRRRRRKLKNENGCEQWAIIMGSQEDEDAESQLKRRTTPSAIVSTWTAVMGPYHANVAAVLPAQDNARLHVAKLAKRKITGLSWKLIRLTYLTCYCLVITSSSCWSTFRASRSSETSTICVED
ncbi:hypothetical protein KIN20_027360 [Parelaphostrongylus tenuis]|uniref:Uncharacterized protein n=1 Tax=Parelaphostrongylus tenuis TaxID=148309 RepID=A0AAD5QZ72_PARTN|nr:hypothetical protein KIN20_027360 [Parelaphostrongylus tenuis]